MQLIQFGLGPVGCEIVRNALRRGYKYLAAVDNDPRKVGRDLSEIIGWEEKLNVPVYAKWSDIPFVTKGAIVTHATGSSLRQITAQLLTLLKDGCTIISTCEELSYPYRHHAEESAILAGAAIRYRGRLLGTGVNPGFIMDFLPLIITTAAQQVSAIRIERIVNAGHRRGPLQKKVGVGLTPEEFMRGIKEGWIGHVGLPESVAMLADGLQWPIVKIEEEIEPVIADRLITGGIVDVEPGRVAGLHQVAYGMLAGGEKALVLDLTMAVGQEAVDRIIISGQPELTVEVRGGVHGDLATAAVVVNTIPAVLDLPPGLYTMLDLNKTHFSQLNKGGDKE